MRIRTISYTPERKKRMLYQYDKAKAKILAELVWGTSIKAHTSLVSLVESVVSGAMSSNLLQKLLADLLAARSKAATPAEQTAIDGAIADVAAGLHAVDSAVEVAAVSNLVVAPTKGVDRPMSKLSPFYGMGLKEACPKLLHIHGERNGKIPLSPNEIWGQLKAEGWTSNHRSPPHSVNDALRRRAQTHRDVLLVGSGKWGRTDWYLEGELEDIRKSVGGMGGRHKGDHIERTKAGMALARARGAQLGASKKLSDEQGQQILDAARAGGTKASIAKQFGISPASVTNYVKRLGYDSVAQLRREGKQLRAKATDDPPTETEPGGTRH